MSVSHEEGRFNLSAWALRHQALVVYLIALATLAGILAYTRLAQSEDPPFTFRVMVIRTFWPGASARQVQEQVTDRIGRKLQETPAIDFLRSYSRPGESLIFFTMKDSAPVKDVPETWYQIRKKVGDIGYTLPPGVQGPFFNDEFGDVYTNIRITSYNVCYTKLLRPSPHAPSRCSMSTAPTPPLSHAASSMRGQLNGVL
ncbi:efflux RND transporter permease subunit, partial [Burkholderia sp. E168m23]|uniref:efflux RND transporter permease subunit n=1 Tax=Burkholderia sp. E168m23 TaxID=1561200 RepID=UPI001F23E5A9